MRLVVELNFWWRDRVLILRSETLELCLRIFIRGRRGGEEGG